MKFKAKAKKAGPCVYLPCDNTADKIYETEHWRLLACSEAHARLALEVIDQFSVKDVKKVLTSDQKCR